VVYGFDMNLDIVHVMDPKRTCDGRDILEATHLTICSRLLDGLVECVNDFFDGWVVEKKDWSFLYHENINVPCRE
jgi:hypothetical protein